MDSSGFEVDSSRFEVDLRWIHLDLKWIWNGFNMDLGADCFHRGFCGAGVL